MCLRFIKTSQMLKLLSIYFLKASATATAQATVQVFIRRFFRMKLEFLFARNARIFAVQKA